MFTQFSARYLADLDAMMRQVVNRWSDYPSDFLVMLRYALGWVDEHGRDYHQPTGKRIRPLLLLLCTESAGGDWRVALPAAAAVELLHNFSLIHDDIQDQSPTRHNRPTVWKIWGYPNAINAGDAMFALSYIALESLSSSATPEITVRIWQIFNRMVMELTRGQHLDMQFEHQSTVTPEDYISMISGKSAALIAACAQMGALIAQGEDDLAALYASFGLNLGIAFQIRDDILGIWGDPAITGKSAATDIVSHKKSLPVLYALTQGEELTGIYQREPFSEADVREAVMILNRVGARTYAQEQETRYYELALEALDQAKPVGQAGENLHLLVNTLFGRQF